MTPQEQAIKLRNSVDKYRDRLSLIISTRIYHGSNAEAKRLIKILETLDEISSSLTTLATKLEKED